MKMSKLIILFLGLLLSTNCAKEDEIQVFPYDVELDDICDKSVLLEISEYIDHYTFREFHTHLKSSNELDVQNMITSYNEHVAVLSNYVKELESIQKEDIIKDRLERSSEGYVITKIFRIAMEISKVISGSSPDMPLFPEDVVTFGNKRKEFFLKKLEFFFNKNPVNFMTETKIFTVKENEKNEGENSMYFEGELCRLLDFVIPVVQFYLSKSDNQYVIDQIAEKDRVLLIEFFQNFFAYNRETLSCNSENFVKDFLKLFFQGEDLRLLLEDLPLPNIDNNDFLTNLTTDDDTVAKNIHKMDKNFMDVKKKLYRLDLPTIKEYIEHPHHYSQQFIKYLDEVYVKIFDIYKGDGTDKINMEKKAKHTALRLTRLLYKLYIYARAIDVPEDEKIGKDFSKEKEPILEFLLKLIMGKTFQITNEPEDETDDVLRDVNLTKQEVRNDFLALIPILNEEEPETEVLDFNKQLDDDTPEIKPRRKTFVDKNARKVFDVLKNFGQISDLNKLMKGHVLPDDLQDNLRKNTVNVALTKIDDKFANRKPKDLSENSEEIDDLVNIVVVKKRKPKNTATRSIRPNFKSSSEEEDLGEIEDNLVDQLVDKIESNIDEPQQEKYWRKFILKFVTKLDVKKQIGDQMWFKINSKLLNIMKQRIHPVDGFFKLFEWALSRGNSQSFFPDYKENFHVQNPEEEELYKTQIKNQKMVSMIDNVLFVVMAKETETGKNIEDLEESEKPHTTAWFQKFHGKSYTTFLNENILNGPFFYDRFHSFEFFFEVVDIFRAFDNVSVSTAEERDRYGEIFLNLYKFVLDVREELNESLEDDPVEFLLYMLDECLVSSYGRDGPSQFDVDNKFCNQSYKNYMEIIWFLKYYSYEKNDEHDNEDEIEAFWNLPVEDMFLVETSPFVIYMNKGGNKERMLTLCSYKGEEEQHMQLCLEYEMFQMALETLASSGYSFKTFNDKVFEPYRAKIDDRKYILWNVLEAIHRYDKNTFQSFLVSFDRDDNDHKSTLDLISFLEITEDDDDWFINYMKYNFGLYTVQYRALEHAVEFVYENNLLEKYLFDLQKFNYHGYSDEHQVFHFRNIGIFLYFAHTDENYQKLAHYIRKQGWLVLLFKNGEFSSHDKLLQNSKYVQWVDRDEENADQLNADKLYLYLEEEKPKMKIEKDLGVKVKKAKVQPQASKDRMARFKNRNKKKQKSEDSEEMLNEQDILKKMKNNIQQKVRVTRETVNIEKIQAPQNEAIDVTLRNGGPNSSNSQMLWNIDMLNMDGEEGEEDFNSQGLIDKIQQTEEDVVVWQEVTNLVEADKLGSIDIPKGMNKEEAVSFLGDHFKLSDTSEIEQNAKMTQYLNNYLNSENNLTITIAEVEVNDNKKKII